MKTTFLEFKNEVPLEMSLQDYTQLSAKNVVVPNIGTLFTVISKSQTLCIVLYKPFVESCYLSLKCCD